MSAATLATSSRQIGYATPVNHGLLFCFATFFNNSGSWERVSFGLEMRSSSKAALDIFVNRSYASLLTRKHNLHDSFDISIPLRHACLVLGVDLVHPLLVDINSGGVVKVQHQPVSLRDLAGLLPMDEVRILPHAHALALEDEVRPLGEVAMVSHDFITWWIPKGGGVLQHRAISDVTAPHIPCPSHTLRGTAR